MALGRKGLTSRAIKGLTVCFVCFIMESSPPHCFVWFCIAEPYKAVCIHSET
ncbi:unnamed protein product, partial [Staurois parvus]